LNPGGRVLVADDHPLTLEGLSLAARAAMPGVTVTSVGSIADAVAAVRARQMFRMILLDYQLPDARGYSGFLAIQHLAPAVPIVMVTAMEEPTLIEAARALGAAGFVHKSLPLDEIAARLRSVAAGRTSYPAESVADSSVAAAYARISSLSKAQHSVLIALADGRSNKEIARDLDVTEATIKAHLTAIFRKLGVNNRSQALLAVQPLFRQMISRGPS
jgi:DNA-binding NarL/FixJ family response regulator